MTIERRLTSPGGYDATANPRITSFAAQLDDQLALLKKNTAGLETHHLEWQPHPGVNTVGMLLAHLAVVDAARAATHGELRKWRDTDLAGAFPLRDRSISREWSLYHVLEHFSGHHGQILLLKHLMRDAGVLPRPEPK